MKHLTPFVFFLLLHLPVFAQDSASMIFRGVLKSESTKKEVPYALITIQDKPSGVASNENGEFEFVINPDYKNDTILIKAMGYKIFRGSVNSLLKKTGQTIFLKDTVYKLQEVAVSSMAPADMVLKALDAPINNPNDPYQMDCFYRNTIKENGTYVKLMECLFIAYDRGFNYKNINKAVDVKYIGVRNSNDYRNPAARLPYPFFRPQWLLTQENYARNRKDILDNIQKNVYDIEFDVPKYFDDQLVYVINAKPKDNVTKYVFAIRFYVRETDLALVQVDFDGKDKIAYIKPSGIPGHLRLKVNEFKNTYVFKEYNKKMYMHYLNDFAAYEWYDSRSGKLISSCEENSQALAQNIDVLDNGKSTLKGVHRKMIPKTVYDPAEWAKEDMVSQIHFDEKIKKDLEKTMPLGEQFNRNAKN